MKYLVFIYIYIYIYLIRTLQSQNRTTVFRFYNSPENTEAGARCFPLIICRKLIRVAGYLLVDRATCTTTLNGTLGT